MRRTELDRPLLILVTALVIVGVSTLYSAGQTDFPTIASDMWLRQLGWLAAGVVGAILIFRVSPHLLDWITPFIYAFAILLLIVTLFFGSGAGTAAGSRSWIDIGGVHLGQPAEFAKFATILLLARHLAGRRYPPRSLAETIPAGVIVLVPFLLVGLQPDLGSAIVFLGILFAMLFWVGVRPWLLLLLVSPMVSLILAFSTGLWGAWIVSITLLLFWLRPFVAEALVVWGANAFMGVVALGIWQGLAPYQRSRILSFINPEVDPRATGWNIIQSQVAIGSGGVFGKGFTAGTQKRLAFLPAQYTDFIYSIVGEEFGFLGVLLTLALFAALLLALIRIARTAVDPYSSMAVAGVAGMILTHVAENIGMTVGLLPVAGIPLPFFSYGGSFLIICLISVGMALRVSRDAQLAGYGAA